MSIIRSKVIKFLFLKNFTKLKNETDLCCRPAWEHISQLRHPPSRPSLSALSLHSLPRPSPSALSLLLPPQPLRSASRGQRTPARAGSRTWPKNMYMSSLLPLNYKNYEGCMVLFCTIGNHALKSLEFFSHHVFYSYLYRCGSYTVFKNLSCKTSHSCIL